MCTLVSHVTFVRHIKKDEYCWKTEPVSGKNGVDVIVLSQRVGGKNGVDVIFLHSFFFTFTGQHPGSSDTSDVR